MALQARHHRMLRFCALAITVASLGYAATRSRSRADITSERLSQLTPATHELIRGISAERPVTVHAYVSKEVPPEYVEVRLRLINLLREMEAQGGQGLTVHIVEPELYSTEAEEAMEKWNILPRPLVDREGGRLEELETFLGLAFVSGPREEVVPFLDRGLSVEYEIARALRVVTQDKKKVVGIWRTDATIMGNFDIQSRSQQPAWRIVDELRKQYDVRSLNPKEPVPEDVDVLFVPQLPSCGQDELDNVRSYIEAGRPALLTVDPFPLFDIRTSPNEEKLPPPGQQGGMFGGGGGPPAEPKGDYKALLRDVGVEWDADSIITDSYNPHPTLEQVPRQIVFVGPRQDGSNSLTGDASVDGLTEIVMMFAGELKPAPGWQDKFTPLLSAGPTSGSSLFDAMVQRHPLFGVQGPMPPRPGKLEDGREAVTPPDGKPKVLAARIKGGGTAGEGGTKDRNLVVIADLDLFGNNFYAMHERGGDVDADGLDDVRFDNVTFLLNAVDSLVGDDRFVELRKRKSKYRRLDKVDQLKEDERGAREKQTEDANKSAEGELEEAKKSLEAAVEAIQRRTDLDETTKQIMLKSAEQTENRRLVARTESIEREKRKAVGKVETRYQRESREIEDRIRIVSVLVPPIPALLLGGFIYARKRRREHDAIPQTRRTGSPPPTAGSETKADKNGGEA
ncbi:MAG: Gldg family protein [Deltaproteobacteria bacterium]|nr:Gldg family protein [Nannocystaceae bacterium]